jgi:hypothetical protein
MKLHSLVLAGTALLLSLSVSPARADQAAFSAKVKATADLLGYWSFEGNYNDQAGKGNNAKVAGDAALVKACEGVKGGQGVEIDNNTATGQFLHVDTPIGSIFDVQKVTVITWARIVDTPEEGVWQSLVDRNTLWYISMEGKAERGGSPAWDMVTNIYDPANPGGTGTGRVQDAAIFVRPNEWHMYAFTYDGAVHVSYLDGKEVFRKEYAGGIGPTADTPTEPKYGNFNITWGAWEQRDDWFNGCFDDTLFVARALTAEEVKALYDEMMK